MFEDYNFEARGLKQVIDVVRERLENDSLDPIFINTLNPHSFIIAQSDHDFQSSLQSSDIILVDGIGIVLAQLMVKGQLLRRICGPDFFLATLEEVSKMATNINIGIIGADDTLIDAAASLIEKSYNNIKVTFRFAPPYKDEFSKEIIDEIQAKARGMSLDILWVCVGAPKQEKLAARLKGVVNVKVISGVGAALAFYTGDDNRAPSFLRMLGLEWLYRSLKNPSRLGKRNFTSNPKFILSVLNYALFKRR